MEVNKDNLSAIATPGDAQIGHSIYVIGKPEQREELRNNLKVLSFLDLREQADLSTETAKPFIVVVCDFEDESHVKTITRCLLRMKHIQAVKILYVVRPLFIDLEHIVFSTELDCCFAAWGDDRAAKLRGFLKAISKSSSEFLTAKWKSQIDKAIDEMNLASLRKMASMLQVPAKSDYFALKLLVRVVYCLRDFKKTISYLKMVLKNNPQDLWAANLLGKIFLDNHQVAKGIEILETESDFVVHPSDEIDFEKGVLAGLNLASLNAEMLSFLNLRAVMAIRADKTVDGIKFYEIALAGCRQDPEIQAKLHYNIGLAWSKIRDFEKAAAHLQASVTIGALVGFDKAAKPLEVALKNMQTNSPQDLDNNNKVLGVPQSTGGGTGDVGFPPKEDLDSEEMDMTNDP